MKRLLFGLSLVAFAALPLAFAEDTPLKTTAGSAESDTAPVADLCKTYAEENEIATAKKDTYIAECMDSMTDLSESMQETLPLLIENSNEPAVTPTAEKIHQDPEQLVQNELVETPDPGAEQLEAKKP